MNKVEPQEITPQTLAQEFLKEFQASGTYRRDLIERLAGQAASDQSEVLRAATGAIFASIVEKLADSFAPQSVTLYNRVFAQLIHFCRQTAPGARLDRELAGFGLSSEADVLARAERQRHIRRLCLSPQEKQRIKRAIILSRVTIGADVAVTSVVVERLKTEFPHAEIVLLGGAKTAELFGGDGRVRFAEVHYQRGGTLIDRLSSWLEVLQAVRQRIAGLQEDQYFIADPDSRLTQLGLLPLVGETPNAAAPTAKAPIRDNHIFFPSRELGSQTDLSLSLLTSVWLSAVFGKEESTLPQLSLRQADIELAKAVVGRLRQGDGRPIVAINFGVGENPAKRLPEDFEKRLLQRLLQDGVKVIFDKGFGEAECQRANAVLEVARGATRQGRKLNVLEVDQDSIEKLCGLETSHATESLEADVLVWQGRIGLLAALIGQSDLYIGYDSAGQHIASALQIPCIDVFAGFSSPRMPQRWHPTGKAASRLIAVDTLLNTVDADAVLTEVLQHARGVVGSRQ